MAKRNSLGLKVDLSTGIRVVLAALGLGGLVLVLGNGLLVQLYIGQNIAGQLAGLDLPSLVVLIPLSLNSLGAVLGAS